THKRTHPNSRRRKNRAAAKLTERVDAATTLAKRCPDLKYTRTPKFGQLDFREDPSRQLSELRQTRLRRGQLLDYIERK
ncbi:MAG TPA: hypothetical protein VE574_00105, partial [Nitrososphaeraceae archaeon]|nr:hypothetical protein [Nitrososphaeraceae archaeon]